MSDPADGQVTAPEAPAACCSIQRWQQLPGSTIRVLSRRKPSEKGSSTPLTENNRLTSEESGADGAPATSCRTAVFQFIISVPKHSLMFTAGALTCLREGYGRFTTPPASRFLWLQHSEASKEPLAARPRAPGMFYNLLKHYK